MTPERAERLTDQLLTTFEFKRGEKWLAEGICPQCGERELYAAVNEPWWVRCNRTNHCAYEASIKDVFPREFEDFNKSAPPTLSNPNATAQAYLRDERGFDLKSIQGWWTQEKFWHPRTLDGGTATVRFYLDRPADIYFERLIKPQRIKEESGTGFKVRKAQFHGSYRGRWWAPPGQLINPGDRVFLTEGIFDAMALAVNGHKAAALLSDRHYPAPQIERHRDVEWAFALDPDTSGQSAMFQHVRRAREDGHRAIAALIPTENNKKEDWNDLHLLERLTPKTLEEALYRGRLLMANNAAERGLMEWIETRRNGFAFEFGKKTYWFELNMDQYTKVMEVIREADPHLSSAERAERAAIECRSVQEIASCTMTFLYYQRREETDEAWYFARLRYERRDQNVTFTGSQLSAHADFKKRLLHLGPGGHWQGRQKHLDWMVKFRTERLMTVQTIDFIGYSDTHQAYLFNDRAVQAGRTIPINRDEYYELGRGVAVKSLNRSVQLSIGTPAEYWADWPETVYRAYGVNGLVAAAFWFASLFAEQVREQYKDFPFLEIVGEPGAGKTTLVEFLWRTFGRKEEGFDPVKGSFSGRARRMAQVSGMPVVLIEADRDEEGYRKKTDWEEYKSLYDGRSTYTRGKKTTGLETYEPSFRGAIVIAQNNPVNASEAILQRICHLVFSRENHSPASYKASERLQRCPIESVSHFLERATLAEASVLRRFAERYPYHRDQISAGEVVKIHRLAETHGKLAAFAEAFSEVVKLPQERCDEMLDRIYQMAEERQQACNADHPIVAQFWEVCDYLEKVMDCPVNHSRKEHGFAINLNDVMEKAAKHHQQLPPMLDLKRHLKASASRKFVEYTCVRSAIALHERGDAMQRGEGKIVKCFVFDTHR